MPGVVGSLEKHTSLSLYFRYHVVKCFEGFCRSRDFFLGNYSPPFIEGNITMGMTIEFYTAQQMDLVALFSAYQPGTHDEHFYDQLETYPVADFSFHLYIPEDMDSLCQTVRRYQPTIPAVFRELLVEQVWYDGSVESLTLVARDFAEAMAQLDEHELETVAAEWAAPFEYDEPLHQTPGYKALLQLREVARDVVTRNRSLL